ncbi:MAG: hypothetical protein KA204_02675 [Chromatiaceae bacterium]|nr:hypothetical protein [Chromatiaceae bacterium]MBP6806912.1 hypothetical protein [Chromatiaceae bacterium]MBP8197059.1 hypothetical protein [Chromatiaceae bacterium]
MKRLLFIALVGLSLLLVLQWRDWPPQRNISRPDTPGDTLQPPGERRDNPLAQLPSPVEKQDYVSVTERPLFLPGRRPPEETPESEDQGAQKEVEPLTALDAMDLNAVIITPDGAVAWVSTPNSPKPQKVRIGDEFEGWKVKAITPDNVEVQGLATTDSLILRNYGQGGQPAQNRPPRPAAKPGGGAAKPSGRPRQTSPPMPRPPVQPNGVKPQRPPQAVPK